MAVNGKSRRSYRGAPVSNTLGTTLSLAATNITLAVAMSGFSTDAEPFFVVVDPGTAKEEKICVKYSSATTLTVVDPAATSTWGASAAGRGADNTTDRQHEQGAVIYPVFTALEANQSNELVSKFANAGSVVYQGSGAPGTFTELAIGTAAQVLKVNAGATAPEWGQVSADGIATGAVTSAKILDDTIVNADINSAAAIAYSKLNLATSIVNADVSASAAIALSKLATTGTVTATTFVGALTGTASGNLVSGGALGTPSSGTLTNCTFPTLNQNTTGNAATATNVAYSGLTGAVPTWNQNTTGSSASCTGNAATASDASLLGGAASSEASTASTIARRDSSGSLSATGFVTSNTVQSGDFLATDATAQFYSNTTFTYIGNNCARVTNAETVYTQLVAGRAMYVSVNGTLGNLTSSRRYKENIVEYHDASNKLLNVSAATFDYRIGLLPEDEQEERYNQFGLIAEDLHDAGLAHLVYYNAEGQPDAVDYTKIAVELLGIVKKQQAVLNELTTRVQALEA